MRRAFRLVIGCFPTAARFRGGVSAVLAVAALTMLGSLHTASGAESPRGLHVISIGNINPFAVVLAADGTPWFTASKYDPISGHGADLLINVTADGRVLRYHLPKSGETFGFFIAWGADGAFWAVDEAIGGLLRATPDGRYTRFRDVWATRETLAETLDIGTPNIIAGPDGRIWLGDRAGHRIVSVAADGSTRVVATLGGRAEPDLLATGPDGSVWFSQVLGKGLRRVLPDGRVEAVRYPNSEIRGATVAPNGDVWFIRSNIVDQTIVKRTDLVRIDGGGRVTEFRAPRLVPTAITAAADATVWIAGLDGNGLARGDVAGVLARMDKTGRFTRIFRAPGWGEADVRAAPDGRLWLLYENGYDGDSVAWLPPNPCLSRRRILVHLHSRHGDPIRRVRLSVQGRLPRTFHDREPSIPIDLRGYLPGAVSVTLKIRTAHRRYTRHRVYHTCASSG
jgi:streptogramin lyase